MREWREWPLIIMAAIVAILMLLANGVWAQSAFKGRADSTQRALVKENERGDVASIAGTAASPPPTTCTGLYDSFCSFPDTPTTLPTVTEYPNPFVMQNGTQVTTLSQWNQRQTELRNILGYYLWGHTPPASSVSVSVVNSTDTTIGSITQRRVNLTYTGPNGTLPFFVTMYIPHASSGPFANGVPSNGPYPIILSGEASWCTLTSYHDGCAPTSQAGLEALVNRGYIVAEFGRDNFSNDPDGDGPASYIFNHGAYTLFPYDSFGVNGYDWTAALAWGWGYSRVIDYFETLSYVDKNHICVTGISRGGTASLYAGANDPRIALTVQVQGGSLNARWTNPTYDPESFSSLLWRGAPGGPGTTGYFSVNLWPFINNINKLPFDSPSIAALIAPRALLVQADIRSAVFPWEMTLAYLAEKKIWQALGVPGKVGLYTTNQGHYMADAVWNAALDFADQVFFRHYVRTPAATAASVPEQPTDYNTPYWSDMPVTNTWSVPDLTH